MVFRPIIGIIHFAGAPVELELLLAFAVAKPMEAHVHGLRAFWLNFAIDYGVCHGVVCLDRRRGLLVTHFGEYDSDVYSLSRHDVQRS